METLYPREEGSAIRCCCTFACTRTCARDKGHRLIHWGGVSVCVLQGASDISARHDWNKGRMRRCASVCVPIGGRWGYRRGGGVFVCPGESCRRLLPNPINSFWMHSFSCTSDEEKEPREKKGKTPKVQYLVCINLCPIPQETLLIISISLSVRGTGSSAVILWHIGVGNEKDKPSSLQTPSKRQVPDSRKKLDISLNTVFLRCVWGARVSACHPKVHFLNKGDNSVRTCSHTRHVY